MKKKHAKRIREIAEQVGTLETQIFTDEPIKGWELLLSGYGKQPRANEIIPEATYILSVPTFIERSTEKELKRSFSKKGKDGIYQVVKKEHDRRFPTKIPV
jgi:hypothetical protein